MEVDWSVAWETVQGIDWEAVRNWATTLAGLLALTVATRTYFVNTRVKREEQPRLVYGYVSETERIAAGAELAEVLGEHSLNAANRVPFKGGDLAEAAFRAVATVENRSNEVIGPVHVILEYSRAPWADSAGMTLTAIHPSSSVSIQLFGPASDLPGTPVLVPVITFRDGGGNWWRRRGSDPLKKMSQDPRIGDGIAPAFAQQGIVLGQGYVHAPSRAEKREAAAMFAWDPELADVEERQ